MSKKNKFFIGLFVMIVLTFTISWVTFTNVISYDDKLITLSGITVVVLISLAAILFLNEVKSERMAEIASVSFGIVSILSLAMFFITTFIIFGELPSMVASENKLLTTMSLVSYVSSMFIPTVSTEFGFDKKKLNGFDMKIGNVKIKDRTLRILDKYK